MSVLVVADANVSASAVRLADPSGRFVAHFVETDAARLLEGLPPLADWEVLVLAAEAGAIVVTTDFDLVLDAVCGPASWRWPPEGPDWPVGHAGILVVPQRLDVMAYGLAMATGAPQAFAGGIFVGPRLVPLSERAAWARCNQRRRSRGRPPI